MTGFLTQLNQRAGFLMLSGYHFGSVGPGYRNEKHLILRHVLRVHYVYIYILI